jgi:hypothetical protein
MRFTALLLALVLVSCAPVVTPPQSGSGDARAELVTLSTERVATDRVRLILQNGYNGPVGYNLCSSGLERRSGASWQPVPTDEVCTMEIRTLPGGQDATFEKRLPPSLSAGEYRYVTSVEIPFPGQMTRIASPGFRVN